MHSIQQISLASNALVGTIPDLSRANSQRRSTSDALFSTTGPCVVVGNCIESSNIASGASSYAFNEDCSITPLVAGIVSATQFDTHPVQTYPPGNYDTLRVGMVYYSGRGISQGPSGVQVCPWTPILWHSGIGGRGWRICLQPGGDHCDYLPLQILDLHGNALSGTLPESVVSLPQLHHLRHLGRVGDRLSCLYSTASRI